MQLVGSQTSPFVRRIRLYAEGKPLEFVPVNIFTPEGRSNLRQFTPVMKVPVLVDGDLTLLDSRQIHRYLADTFNDSALSWDQENLLTLIDAVNDSLVTLFIGSRSGIDTSNPDLLMVKLQNERIQLSMDQLNKEALKGAFDEWHYPSICLFCLLDWASFRGLLVVDTYPALMHFYKTHQSHEHLKESDPRLAEA
jgi:glutathione S-transferase